MLDRLEPLVQWDPWPAGWKVTDPPPADRFAPLDDYLTGLKHYNRSGDVISFRQWVEMVETGSNGVEEHWVRSDRGWVRVSTILLGLDHRFWNPEDSQPPIIFETMTFSDSEEYAYLQWRHCDLQTALQAHRQVADELAQSWWTNLGGLA